MKVQTKISLLLLLIVMIFAGGIALIKVRERGKFNQIALERTAERTRSFEEFLDRAGEPLEMLAKDYTYWDALVGAIGSSDESWLDANINNAATWEGSDAHAIWIYRPDRTRIKSYNRLYADDDLRDIPLPPAAFDALERARLMHFFLRVPQGVMEIRAATIHPSSDSWRRTAPLGYFFAGQLWSGEAVKNLARDSNNTVTLDAFEAPRPTDAEDAANGVISFVHPLLGWDGKPIARLTVSNGSAIIKELNRSGDQLLLLLILFGFAVLLLLTVSLTLWVSRPLWMISQTLKSEDTAQLDQLHVSSSSEFGNVAKLIREFFHQKASLIAEINERKSAQEALRLSGEQLRQAQKMEAVGRLAGGVAHDFNNLLTAIIGYAELLAGRRDIDPGARQNVEAIRKAGQQAAAVTHQLLAFSRKQILQPRVLDLNALVVEFEKILRRVIGEHMMLRIRARASCGRVRADPNQLEQVLLNLSVNARDAMPKGGKLTIRTTNLDLDEAGAHRVATDLAPGRFVVLEVADTGDGMDEEIRSRIFEPFFTTKGPGKGTGLGLATVYGIVKQSGGALTVDSKIGEGSTFRMYLPMETAPVEETRPKTVAPMTGTSNYADTVLVVEDEEIVRELVCQVLGSQGYNVLCAANGRDAMLMSADHSGPIRLMITDIVMPQMGGIELSRRLAEERPEMRVLFVSGYSENDISEQGVLDPGLEFLEKPFTPQSLTRKVREVIYPQEGADTAVPPVAAAARAGQRTDGEHA